MLKQLFLTALVVAAVSTACTNNNVFDLEVGQCFDDPDAFDEVSSVEIVDCADPHDNEVYHVFDVIGYDEWPGEETISVIAEESCVEAFAGYVGRDFASSSLAATSLSPSEESWDEADDREIVCFLFDLTLGPLEGSVRNSGL